MTTNALSVAYIMYIWRYLEVPVTFSGELDCQIKLFKLENLIYNIYIIQYLYTSSYLMLWIVRK